MTHQLSKISRNWDISEWNGRAGENFAIREMVIWGEVSLDNFLQKVDSIWDLLFLGFTSTLPNNIILNGMKHFFSILPYWKLVFKRQIRVLWTLPTVFWSQRPFALLWKIFIQRTSIVRCQRQRLLCYLMMMMDLRLKIRDTSEKRRHHLKSVETTIGSISKGGSRRWCHKRAFNREFFVIIIILSSIT